MSHAALLHPLTLGPWTLSNNLMLAPMAGITDSVFRQLCRKMGAGYAVGEMTHSRAELRQHRKSRTRQADRRDPEPRAVQLLGYDPQMLADAARWHVERGAQVIDLNLGCPAKKVCNVAAGSALMGEPKTVATIFKAVVSAVNVPVTVKMRTGPDMNHRNAVQLARMAEDCGLQMVVIHGRTRAQKFQGEAEYDTIAEVKQQIGIPVIANGDIDSPEKARHVLEYTAADGIMIGRASCGKPWLFQHIAAHLEGRRWQPPSSGRQIAIMRHHVAGLHRLYGETTGVRMARKHVGWYLQTRPEGTTLRQQFNRLQSAQAQLEWIDTLHARMDTCLTACTGC